MKNSLFFTLYSNINALQKIYCTLSEVEVYATVLNRLRKDVSLQRLYHGAIKRLCTLKIANQFLTCIVLFSLFTNTSCVKKEEVAKLTSIPVIKNNFKKEVHVKGIVKPMRIENITTPNDLWGTIEKLIPEGTKVKKGDFVAKINVREFITEYAHFSERVALGNIEIKKQKAQLPFDLFKLDIDLNKKENELKAKKLDFELVKKNPKEDVKQKNYMDIKLSELSIKSSSLNKKKELYKKGYVSQEELNTSTLDDETFKTNLKKAKISKIQLSPEYNKYELKKSQLLTEQSSIDFKINKIEKNANVSSLIVKSRNSSFRSKHYKRRYQEFKRKVELATLTAPIDGIVIYPKIWGTRKPSIGMEVWSGFAFLNVSQIDKLKIEAQVNEIEITDIKNGSNVEISIDSLPNKVFLGKVSNISKLSKYKDERKQQGLKYFDVDILVDNKLDLLHTNMNVNLKILSESLTKSVQIPSDALIEENKKYFVYFDENNKPTKKEVKIKAQSSDFTVLSGNYTGNEKVYIMSKNNA